MPPAAVYLFNHNERLQKSTFVSIGLQVGYLSYQNFFRTVPSVVSQKYSEYIFGGFGLARGLSLESDIFSFETILNNFTSISTISQNFRIIRTVVTENSPGQNLGRKKKKQKNY